MYHYAANNPVRYTDPDGRELAEGASVSEQLTYLKNIVNTTYKTPQQKADAAKALRSEMRNTNSKAFNIDELMTGKDGNEKFMNEDLRDFLNTSDSGTDYTFKDMEKDGWKKCFGIASQEHQTFRGVGVKNLKFVNEDGREAVFIYLNGDWVLSKNPRDKGTYNYAKKTWQFWASSEHGRWDMNPYFRQFGITPDYRKGVTYSQNDYNKNNN